MKTNSNETKTTPRNLVNTCTAFCQRLSAQIQNVKQAILDEYSKSMSVPQHLLRLAINEAEALARQTEFPELVFPTLAMEKAQAIASWANHQRSIVRTGHYQALAA